LVPPAAGTSSRGTVVDGTLVYPQLWNGTDGLYVVDDDRIEEFFFFRDAASASKAVFDVEVGPGVAGFRQDGSGFGLEAFDDHGTTILRAPLPEGIDAAGNYVGGALHAEKTETGHWTIHVTLRTPAPAYPVLLDPTWAGTATMATKRMGHTSTFLGTSGKVLIAGGTNGLNVLASAEVYEPNATPAPRFVSTGALGFPRKNHTATRLKNGNILLAAGSSGAARLASTEIYTPAADPTLGNFKASTPLLAPRFLHTATLLDTPSGSGVVLLAGGDGEDGNLAAAELFDATPTTPTVTAAGAMGTPRNSHFATLLKTGKVLVGGGFNNLTYLPSAETFDPVSKLFGPVGAMPQGRSAAEAVLLPSGKVLVVGGIEGDAEDDAGDSIQIYPANGALFDPLTSLFAPTAGAMTSGRIGHTATLLNTGRVLVAGGSSEVYAASELYDPTSDSFAPLTSDPATGTAEFVRVGHTATLLANGSVLLTGGNFEGVLSSSTLYVPCTSELTCSNHGTCTANDSCSCTQAFAGARCDACADGYYNYPTCVACNAATTCGGNGQCSNLGTCTCNPGFLGTNCQFSNEVTCNDHGVVNANGSCTCRTGYRGQSCNACSPSYFGYPDCQLCLGRASCSNKGSCSPAGGCACDPGYGGVTCQFSNAVTCTDHGVVQNDGSCRCNPGFAGTACDACAPDAYVYPTCTICVAATTCNGRGKCTDTGACKCNKGFTGKNCEVTEAIPCNGHGSLQSDGSCKCAANFSGARCDACAPGFATYPSCATRLDDGGLPVANQDAGTTAKTSPFTMQTPPSTSGGTCAQAPGNRPEAPAWSPLVLGLGLLLRRRRRTCVE
jgi:hypothetical protein